MMGGGAMAMACGERVKVGELSAWHYPLLCCCPCCLGPPCSHNRRTNYRNMLKTFSGAVFVVCVVMFVAEVAVEGGVVPVSVNPMVGPSASTLAHMGAAYGYRMQVHWEVYRLFSPVFLHGGLLHLLGNMMYLLFLGVPLEQRWGWPSYAFLFVGCGVGASLFAVCVHPNAISVGASGALFGLMGASLAHLLLHWGAQEPQGRRMQLLQQAAALLLLMAFSFGAKYVDAWAHVGGLLYGALFALLLWAPASHLPFLKRFGRPLAAALLLAASALMLALFFAAAIPTSSQFPDGY